MSASCPVSRAAAARRRCSPACRRPPDRRRGSEPCGPSRSVHTDRPVLLDNRSRGDGGRCGPRWWRGVAPEEAAGRHWLKRRRSLSRTRGSRVPRLLLLPLCFLVAQQPQSRLFLFPAAEVDCDWSSSAPVGSGWFLSGPWQGGAGSGPVAAGPRWAGPGLLWSWCDTPYLNWRLPR